MKREKIKRIIANIREKSNLICEFSELEEKYTNEFIEFIAQRDIKTEFENVNIKAYDLNYKISTINLKNKNEDEILRDIKNLIDMKSSIEKEFCLAVEKKRAFRKEEREFINNAIEKILYGIKLHLSNKINLDIITSRITAFEIKLLKVSDFLNYLDRDEIILKNIELMSDFINSIEIKNKSNVIEENKINKDRIKKIFDYKKLNKIAEDNGFVKDRYNGDHLIMKNKENGNSVPIPQRQLDYGLMYTIQKQIKEYSN